MLCVLRLCICWPSSMRYLSRLAVVRVVMHCTANAGVLLRASASQTMHSDCTTSSPQLRRSAFPAVLRICGRLLHGMFYNGGCWHCDFQRSGWLSKEAHHLCVAGLLASILLTTAGWCFDFGCFFLLLSALLGMAVGLSWLWLVALASQCTVCSG